MDGAQPIHEGSSIWGDFAPSAEALMELVTAPSSFSTDKWIEKGVLKRWTQDEPVVEGVQWCYSRICRMDARRYREVSREYIKRYGPVFRDTSSHLGAEEGCPCRSK